MTQRPKPIDTGWFWLEVLAVMAVIGFWMFISIGGGYWVLELIVRAAL